MASLDQVVAARPRRKGIPWFSIVVLSILLLLTQYSLTYIPDREVLEEGFGSVRRQVSITAFGLLGLMFFLSAKGWRLRWHFPLLLVSASMGAWLALSLSWSLNPALGVRRLAVIFLVFFGAYGLVVLWPRRALLPFIVVAGCFQLTLGVLSEIAHGVFLPLSPDYRFSGTLTPNEQGAICAILALAGIAAVQSGVGHKLLYSFSAMCGIALLLLTKTLTSFAGFLAGIAVYWFLRFSSRGRHRIVYLGVMVLLLAIFFVSVFGFSLGPFAKVAGRHPDDMITLTGRIPLWARCMEYVAARPLIGYGYAGQLWTPDRSGDLDSELGWLAGSAHSAYIELWLELGIVGLVLHTAILLLVVRRGAMAHRATQAPEYAMAAGLSAMYFVVGALESASLIWFSSFLFLSYCLFIAVALADTRAQPRVVVGADGSAQRKFL